MDEVLDKLLQSQNKLIRRATLLAVVPVVLAKGFTIDVVDAVVELGKEFLDDLPVIFEDVKVIWGNPQER